MADNDLIAVLSYLADHPYKIKGCKAALASQMFVERSKTSCFEKSVVCFSRVPKGFYKAFLLERYPQLGAGDLMKALEETDKNIAHKLVYWAAGLSSKDPVDTRYHDELKRMLTDRAVRFNVDVVAAVAGGTVCWKHHGWYTLLVRGSGEARDGADLDVEYESVRFNGAASIKRLPCTMIFDSSWLLTANFSPMCATLQTPPGRKPPYKLPLSSLFDGDAAFNTYVQPILASDGEGSPTPSSRSPGSVTEATLDDVDEAGAVIPTNYKVSQSLQSKLMRVVCAKAK